jgi:potassium voltage-gated channel Shaker-related subfamily A member 1
MLKMRCLHYRQIIFYNFKPEVIAELKHLEGIVDDVRPMPDGRFKRAVWMLFEYPDTSTAAQVIAILSVSVTLIAILTLCIETMPYFASSRSCNEDGDVNDHRYDSMTSSPSLVGNIDPFFIVETLCIAWFTIELAIRFAACPSKSAFWKDFKNYIDVASMLPYYIDVLIKRSDVRCVTAIASAQTGSPSLSYLRVIRLARVFKLTKHCVGLQVRQQGAR